jgi:hypothetical protein
MQVIEEKVTNERTRKIFFNVPTAENTKVIRQMSYLGKIIRGPSSHPPRQMLAAWSKKPAPARRNPHHQQEGTCCWGL